MCVAACCALYLLVPHVEGALHSVRPAGLHERQQRRAGQGTSPEGESEPGARVGKHRGTQVWEADRRAPAITGERGDQGPKRQSHQSREAAAKQPLGEGLGGVDGPRGWSTDDAGCAVLPAPRPLLSCCRVSCAHHLLPPGLCHSAHNWCVFNITEPIGSCLDCVGHEAETDTRRVHTA